MRSTFQCTSFELVEDLTSTADIPSQLKESRSRSECMLLYTLTWQCTCCQDDSYASATSILSLKRLEAEFPIAQRFDIDHVDCFRSWI
jgi:hypothetical protein